MVRPVGKRYSLPWEEGESVVPSRIRRFSREKQIQLIAEWFFSLYEDPANETPYDGREGGYQYIHGGPYDAREEIEAEFLDYVDADILEAAADFVETDGILDWAPSSQHPDRIASDREAEASQEPDKVQIINFGDDIRIGQIRSVHRIGYEPQVEKHQSQQFDDVSGAPDGGTFIHPDVEAQKIDGAVGLRSGALFKGDSKGTFMAFGKSQERPAYGRFANFEEIEQRIRNGVAPNFGSDRELVLRAELRDHAGALKALLHNPPKKHGGIGHNRPPENLDAAKPSVKEIGDAVDEIVEQIEKSEPDISKIVGAGKVINRLLDAVLIGGGVFALSAMKVLGDKAGERYADALLDKAEETLITLLKWFESINFSF